jgi:hypothetical protein
MGSDITISFGLRSRADPIYAAAWAAYKPISMIDVAADVAPMLPVEECHRQVEKVANDLLHQFELEQPHQALHGKLARVRAESARQKNSEEQADDHPERRCLTDCGRQLPHNA